MSMALSHTITALIFILLGIWVGRRTNWLSDFIKAG